MITLLTLPGELRNRIWEYATFPASDVLYIQSGSHEEDVVRSLASSPVFRICAQARSEALVYLLQTRCILIEGVHSTLAFCRWAGVYAQENMSNLTVRCASQKEYDTLEKNHAFFKELKKLRALKKLQFVLKQSQNSKVEESRTNLSIEKKRQQLEVPEAWKVFKDVEFDKFWGAECAVTILHWPGYVV